jgi:hypothetical protein
MELTGFFSNVQWLPALVMTIFSFILGFIWHRPELFGKIWELENKADKEKLKKNAPLIFLGTAVFHFITLASLSSMVAKGGSPVGIATGLVVSVLFILPAMAGTYLFAGRSIKLLAIDAGMYIILYTISGWILSIW